jgi:hypothetical protein
MNAPGNTDSIAAKRCELAALAAKLARLRARYDVLMNAFKFDEARALHSRIETAEREHCEAAAELPRPEPPAAPKPYRVGGRRRPR